jgi:hypothetical protein
VFAKIFEFLLGGTRDFNAAEKHLLSCLLEALPVQDRAIFSRQLSSVHKVQRQHPGRLVVAYYRKGCDVPQLPYLGYEHCLANITYRSGGRTKTTSLVLHDGRFMTFEQNVPQNLGEIEAVNKVLLHPNAFKGVATAVDEQEHGH